MNYTPMDSGGRVHSEKVGEFCKKCRTVEHIFVAVSALAMLIFTVFY